MSEVERFERAAEATMKGSTYDAITALLGPEMDDHESIHGDVKVLELREWLDDHELAALGIEDAPNGAAIVGYSTRDGFTLKTAEKVEV